MHFTNEVRFDSVCGNRWSESTCAKRIETISGDWTTLSNFRLESSGDIEVGSVWWVASPLGGSDDGGMSCEDSDSAVSLS